MSQRPRFLRLLGIFAASLSAFYLLLCSISGVALMEKALHTPRRPLLRLSTFNAIAKEWSPSGLETIQITAADGVILKGWYLQPSTWNGSSIVLLHGVADNREGMTQYAPMLLRAGYAVLLPDSRGHGESGGDLVTYGLLEANDVQRWLQWIVQRYGTSSGCRYLLGESMGAAIAIEAASPPQVCAVVAEAPFISFREIGYERIAQGLGTSVTWSRRVAWPVVDAAFFYARLRYRLDFDSASPEARLIASRIPTLLIAGLADENIPPRHASEIAQYTGGASQLWLVPGAGHTTAASINPQEFERRTLDWFATHTAMPVATH